MRLAGLAAGGLVLPDLAATQSLGAAIATMLAPGDIVALSGPLGVGKTTLARGIIAGLGYAGEVVSPSFAILVPYAPPLVRLAVVHGDFYRLRSPAEVAELGLDDDRDHAALIIEWPEHGGGFADDPACLAITLTLADTQPAEVHPEHRHASITPGAGWAARASQQGWR